MSGSLLVRVALALILLTPVGCGTEFAGPGDDDLPADDDDTGAAAGDLAETDAAGEVVFDSELLAAEVGVRVTGPGGGPVEGAQVAWAEHQDAEAGALLHIVVTDPEGRYAPAVLYGPLALLAPEGEREVLAFIAVALAFKAGLELGEATTAVWEAYSELRTDQVVLATGEEIDCATVEQFLGVVRAESSLGYRLVSLAVPGDEVVHLAGWVVDELFSVEDAVVDLVVEDFTQRVEAELGQALEPGDLVQVHNFDWSDRVEADDWSSGWAITLDDGACGAVGDDDDAAPTDEDEDGFTSDVDCDDANALVFPGAYEAIDGIDNDCDDNIDYAGWGLISLWDFDSDSADEVVDATTTGNDTNAGGAELVPGYCGSGRQYVAAEDDQTEWPMAAFPAIGGADPVTLALWLRVDQSPTELWVAVFCYQAGSGYPVTSGNIQHCLRLDTGNVPEWATDDPTSYGDRTQAPASALTTGEWHHLVGVYDPAAGQRRLYVDGALAATSGAISGTSVSPAAVVALAGFAPWNQDMDATVDAAMVFAAALDASQIEVLAGAGCP